MIRVDFAHRSDNNDGVQRAIEYVDAEFTTTPSSTSGTIIRFIATSDGNLLEIAQNLRQKFENENFLKEGIHFSLQIFDNTQINRNDLAQDII